MRYSIEKSKQLDRLERQIYLAKYHNWLNKKRKKDKEKLPYKYISNGHNYLNKNLCPYCKKNLEIKKEKNLIFKSCKKHGLMQIRR